MGVYSVTFTEALVPVLLPARLMGVYPANNYTFSWFLFGYSFFIGSATIINRMWAMYFFMIRESDWVVHLSLLMSQLVLGISWVVFLVLAPGFAAISGTMNDLRREAPRRVSRPWLTYSVVVFKVFRLVIFVILNYPKDKLTQLWRQVLTDLFRAPVTLIPLQFAALAELTAQIFAEYEKNLSSYQLDKHGYQLQRFYRLYKIFRRLNEFYSPFLFLSFANTIATCPPFIYYVISGNSHLADTFYVGSDVLQFYYVAFVTAHSCVHLKNQTINFKETVNKLVNRDPYFLRNEITNVFIEYDPKLELTFSKFTIDYYKLIQMFSACNMYVIILLQFGKKFSSRNSSNN